MIPNKALAILKAKKQIAELQQQLVALDSEIAAVENQIPETVVVTTVAGAASATNVGTLKYTVSATDSKIDMCMETADGVFAWVNIKTSTWG